MKKKLISELLKTVKCFGRRRSICAVLGVIVALCTAVVLIHPAITLEKGGSQESMSTVAPETLQSNLMSVALQSDASTGARLVSGKSIVYQVLFDGRWLTVGSSAYSTGTVNGEARAYITSTTAEKYFGVFGYKASDVPGTSFEYSYNDIYNIYYNGTTAYVIDFQDNVIADDSVIWLYQNNGTDAQKFRIWDAGDGYSFISPLRNSGYYINVYGGGVADGTELRLRHETDNASRWKVETDSNGRTTFANANASTAYIDLPNGTQESRNQLHIWNNGANIYWNLGQIYEWNTATGEANGSGYNIGLTEESNGNIICRYTPTLSDGDDIYSIADLAKLKKNGTHRLMTDLTVNGNETGSFITLKYVTSTLDLNGHTISYNPDVTGDNHSFISLGDNANFTVTDNGGKAKDTVETVETDKVYGNTAQWDSNRKCLTYYVTESEVNEDGITRTDTLVKHTVDITNVGAIESTGPNYPTQLIKVESDSSVLNVSGGRFTNPGGKHAVLSTAATSELNVSGGYFCGTKSTEKGAALYATGKTTISGGVIAANSAKSGAGIYYQGKSGGAFTMTDGVISGNAINESGWLSGDMGKGAGITLAMENNSITATLSGGYITNNAVNYYCGHPGCGDHHGGGIYQNGGNLTLTSGDENSEGVFITGNYHKESGGGICFTGQQFTMESGVISSNVATMGEGGGIRLNKSGNTAIIVGGYITNNYTYTTHDWGGGGIFVVQGNSLQIKNSLVSENHARGFGGGVAGCPTGQLIVNGEKTEEAGFSVGITALYNNTADGEVLAGSDGVASSKPQDQKAKANEVFMSSGYQDYFCALNSVLSGTMLGNGSENYKGSCDYVPITLEKGEIIAATSMMGMTANPTQKDIENGKKEAKVFITGNFSGTHGGGVLSNGLLVLGEASNVSLKPGLEISMPKIYTKRTDGSKIQAEANQFNFLLLDDKVTVNGSTVTYTEENIVERLTNNEKGYLSFEPFYPEEVGETVATYYLLEEPGNSPDITYDPKVYKIEIGTAQEQEVRTLANSKEITLTYYLVNRVKVSVVGDPNETQVDGYYWDFNNPNSPNNSTSVGEPGLFLRLSLTFNNGFTNTVDDTPIVLKIVKTDGDTGKLLPFVSFTLKDADGNVIDNRYTAGDSGTVSFQLEKNKSYLISEKPPDGYNQYGPWFITVDGNGKISIYEGSDATGKKISDTSFSESNSEIKTTWNLKNYAGHILPATGGTGTGIYTLFGMIVVSAALIGLFLHKRKQGSQA